MVKLWALRLTNYNRIAGGSVQNSLGTELRHTTVKPLIMTGGAVQKFTKTSVFLTGKVKFKLWAKNWFLLLQSTPTSSEDEDLANTGPRSCQHGEVNQRRTTILRGERSSRRGKVDQTTTVLANDS